MAYYYSQGHTALLLLLVAYTVLSTPPPGYIPSPAPIDEHPPKYEYGYVVSDPEGSTQGHVETRDGIYALGRYHVSLPDGSGQKVTYFADDWGYHPLVSYGSSTEHGSSHAEFAVGEKAVHALKDKGSAAENLISKDVHIINAGASGHRNQEQQSTSINEAKVSTTTTVIPAVSTTIESATGHASFQTAELSTVSHQPTGDVEVSTPIPLLSLSQQQEEIGRLIEAQKQFEQQFQQHSKATSDYYNSVVLSTTEQPQTADTFLSGEISSHNVHPLATPSQFLQVNLEENKEWQEKDRTLSPLSSILLKEVPNKVQVYKENNDEPLRLQIVTPTPIDNSKQSISLPKSENILSSGVSNEDSFTHEGRNVQITSYLADTNRVLHFGDRIQAKEHQSDQRLIDQIQQHAKLRIFEDLQKSKEKPSGLKPIIVTASSITTTTEAPSYHSTTPSAVLNIESHSSGESGYNSVSHVSQVSQPTSPSSSSVFNNAYLESNSLAEKSDYLTQGIASSGGGYITRQYTNFEHLAPLQAGLAILTAPEKQSPPVVEENIEDNSVYKNEDTATINLQGQQGQVGQYQALGYEQRLVDPRAQDVVREPNPTVQVAKKENLAIQQEIELRQVQESLQELQQKIVNDIDAQHEEEQKKQEAVANERQKHLDSLQQVAEILKEVKTGPTGPPLFSPTPSQFTLTNEYHGSEYLPPHQTNEHVPNYSDEANITPTGAPLVTPTPTQPTAPDFQGPQYLPPHQHEDAVRHYSSKTEEFQQEARYQFSHTNVPNIDISLVPPPLPPTIAEVEKPVFIEKPVAVETTKVVEVEKPVFIKETVPEEKIKLVEIEKTVPYPVPVTRLVHVDRPVPVPTPYSDPQPVPIPYPVPHAIGIPIPQFIPYPEILPIPFKQYHPIIIQTKTFQYKPPVPYDLKPSKRMPEQVFKDPKPELFQYSHVYHTIPLHLKTTPNKSAYYRQYYKTTPIQSGRNRNHLKNLRIEYGGFKPPLVPSAEFDDEPKPSQYGPSVKEE